MPLKTKSFKHLIVGDKVYRLLAGTIPMEMTVTAVNMGYIKCGLYTFDRATGVEEYAPFKWGVNFGTSGSVLEDHPDTPLPQVKPKKTKSRLIL